MRWRSVKLVLALLLAASACRRSEFVEQIRRQAEVDRREFDERLDALEARLLMDQARVRFWRELKERHQVVSAIACRNLDGHARDIARFQEEQQVKVARAKSRVATNFVPAGE